MAKYLFFGAVLACLGLLGYLAYADLPAPSAEITTEIANDRFAP